MSRRKLCVVFVMSCVLGRPAVRSQERPLSPEVAQVLVTYRELMQELPAMLARGEQRSDRMSALEAQMAAQVKTAQPQLFTVVQQGDVDAAEAAAYSLKYATNPAAAVTPLLIALDRFDGRLANNVGLTLEYLCRQNPALQIPLEPLARSLAARQWNQQQKVAQVVEALSERGTLTDPDGMLTAALIPMLASQRQQVFLPVRDVLPRITGQSLGIAAEPWVVWFAQTHGRTLDLSAGIYELVQIVQPAIRNGNETFSIERIIYVSRETLLTRLRMDAETARRLNRKFGVAIQIPKEGFPQDRLTALVEAVLPVFEAGVVIQPEIVEFVPFSVALERLQRLLKEPPALQ
jgi:hypothetical protein